MLTDARAIPEAVQWHEGMLLSPQHFQVAARRSEAMAAYLIEAAANFFSHLRTLDGCGARSIAVMPVPHTGLGEAINDRLRRAAGPR